MNRFFETLYDSYSQEFRIDELLYENKTGHQHLLIFHNASFGRVMVLDGVVQTTEKDEFIYHEMLAHVPIFAHGEVGRVLIIGGGDGGMLREVVKHDRIDRITQVEIDQQVIDLSIKYLPKHSQGAFEDSRVNIVIDDGYRFVKTCEDTFDLIISDSTDPIGPGEVLFTPDFYAACKRCLNPGGILVTQNGVPFMQLDEVKSTAGYLAAVFSDWHFYNAAVPTYVGGMMTFGWGSDQQMLRKTSLATLVTRFQRSGITTRYYNPEIHRAAFALPQYVLAAIGKQSNEQL
ncbi:MAG: polyamine aminopropyltransferase [Desulfobacteraceae bacterium]|nr:polyamine aminopropyltransferase [Desulfobacteraceae bacterium]